MAHDELPLVLSDSCVYFVRFRLRAGGPIMVCMGFAGCDCQCLLMSWWDHAGHHMQTFARSKIALVRL